MKRKRFYFSLAAPVERAANRLVSGVVEGFDLEDAKWRLNALMEQTGRPERSRNYAWLDLAEIVVADHGLVAMTTMVSD